MINDYLIFIGIGIVVLFIVVYLYIKDLENNRKLKSYEKSIEELNKQVYNLQKTTKDLEDGSSTTKNSSTHLKKELDDKLNEIRAELQGEVKNAVSSLNPLIDVLQDVQKSFQLHQNKINRRMIEIEERVKAVISIPTNSTSLDEVRIAAMFKNGKNIEEIAKELRVPKGEVELSLRLANLGMEKTNAKSNSQNKS